MCSFKIVSADPQGADALLLLGEAAIEARALYPEHFTPKTPWPGKPPTPPGTGHAARMLKLKKAVDLTTTSYFRIDFHGD
jgi:hypothetical protein